MTEPNLARPKKEYAFFIEKEVVVKRRYFYSIISYSRADAVEKMREKLKNPVQDGFQYQADIENDDGIVGTSLEKNSFNDSVEKLCFADNGQVISEIKHNENGTLVYSGHPLPASEPCKRSKPMGKQKGLPGF